jgi:hypothetical protein
MYKYVTSQVDSSLTDLFTSSWSPCHIDLCHFKVSVLVPLSGDIKYYHVLGFLPIPIPPMYALPLPCDPSPSNHIAVFVLDLKSAYEGEHMIFGLLSVANLAQNDVLQFHSSTWEW